MKSPERARSCSPTLHTQNSSIANTSMNTSINKINNSVTNSSKNFNITETANAMSSSSQLIAKQIGTIKNSAPQGILRYSNIDKRKINPQKAYCTEKKSKNNETD